MDNEILIPRQPNEACRTSQPAVVTQRAYDYPFSQYNLFVECYNNECNRIDESTLDFMPESEMYRFIFQMLVKPLGKMILAFSLIFLPILNIVFYALIWNSLKQYNKAKRVFKNNLLLVQNPFQNMIFSPEVCEIMGKNHWFFQVNEKDIYGFSFDSHVIKQLRKRQEMGQIRFMVYDDTFQNYYLMFPQFYRMHLSWMIISTLFLAAFTVLTVLYILYSINNNKEEKIHDNY